MLVQSALDGYPVCIFAYGQTGSGKTFTMEGGPGDNPQLEGLIPRALRHLFSVAQEMSGQGWVYRFVASYVEIYNETVRDLLATGTRKGQGGECEIRRAGPGSEELTVTNARYVPVSCEKEVRASRGWSGQSGANRSAEEGGLLCGLQGACCGVGKGDATSPLAGVPQAQEGSLAGLSRLLGAQLLSR